MKIRTGFVSNSSSSSFTAIIREDNLDKMEFTAAEEAAFDFMSVSKKRFEGGEVFLISSMSGNIDDLDGIDIKEIAKCVIKYAERKSDPLLPEYREMYEDHISFDRRGYFAETFNAARQSLAQKFREQEKKELCIIIMLDF